MTANELATRRMHELLPTACPPHASFCDGGINSIDCRACEPTDAAVEAMAELRRLGALYPVERMAMAKRIGPTLTRRVWPDVRGSIWRAA